jgi:hypothetical protein
LYRRFLLSGLLAGGLLFVLTGCQKPADQSNPNAASSSSSSSEAAKSGSEAASAPQPLVIPAGTDITVVLDEPVGSKTSSTGQFFRASVHTPVEVEGQLIIPRGAHATGVVRDAKPAGRFKGGAVLSIALTSITINGKDYDVHSSDHTLVSKGKGKRSAVLIGGGGAAGALIGGLAGGGKGAAIGALAGAGAGTGGAALTGDRDITLRAETPVTFKLTRSVEIQP